MNKSFCYRIRRCVSTTLVLLWPWLANACLAFDPPVDRAGPLTVQIVGPEVVTERDAAILIQVVLKNASQRPVSGTLRLEVIDQWRCDPSGAEAFTVQAGGTVTRDFHVTLGARTYSAHYPIHALATFEWQGEPQQAHPIRIVETRLPPEQSQAEPLPWRPLPVTADRRLALWKLPVFRTVLRVFEQPPRTMPTGWAGADQATRTSVSVPRPVRMGDEEKSALAIHPPWHGGGAGTALVEYPLALPEATAIKLRFATAVTPAGSGDGVTFRVRAAPWEAAAGGFGEVAFERHSAATTWESGEADLSRFAGRTIRLQFESHPGPEQNTSFDLSYWAEPTLVVGNPPRDRPFPPPSDDGSLLLGKTSVGPTNYDVRIWPGQRGLLDADIGFVTAGKRLVLRGFQTRVLGDRVDQADSPTVLVEAKAEPCTSGYRVRHRFSGVHGTFDLLGHVYVEDGTMRVKFWLENTPPRRPWFAPRIEAVAVDRFHDSAERVYAGHGNVIQSPQAFRLSFDGHRLATSHVGFDFSGGVSLVQAVDLPPDSLEVDPARHHYSLHAVGNVTLTFLPADSVWQAVKHFRSTRGPQAQAAGGVQRLAGRFVFDLWGGRYGESQKTLERAFRYGLTDAAVVWHNWQRWGYDYRLPEIYPPNPRWGTESELQQMISACRQADVLFALHDNYIDMYPDAEGFSYEQNIAFQKPTVPVKAWLNQHRDARSYRYRADRVEPVLQANLQVIAERLKPTAYFIDVWSSVRPYDYWTADGEFFSSRFTRDTWGRHFSWIRRLLGGDAPQISESGHDQLIGWLDGAQTNHLRVGRPLPGDRGWCVWDLRCQDAERVPWFDAAYHDRFILHGAGYSDRYAAGLDHRLHGMYSDDYLATEVLTGHPAMVSRPFGRDVVRKYWLTQDLARALALRTMEEVTFVKGDLHRQHVRWSGGAEVWVNRGEGDWNVAGHTLPQYGFCARVPTEQGVVQASLDRRQGIIVEQALSPQRVYVNARQIVGGPRKIRPSIETFQAKLPQRIDLQITWQADEPIPEGYRPFVHFVDAAGEIVFQAGCDLRPLAQQRRGRIVLGATGYVPQERKTGEKFELRVGLYCPTDGGARLPLVGADDGQRRYRLGSIELLGQGDEISQIRWTAHVVSPDAFWARQNVADTAIDFGPVVTAGGCRLSQEGDWLLVTPLPESGTVKSVFEIDWDKLPWKMPRPSEVEMLAEDGAVIRRSAMGQQIRIECQPDVWAYRLLP